MQSLSRRAVLRLGAGAAALGADDVAAVLLRDVGGRALGVAQRLHLELQLGLANHLALGHACDLA